MSRRSWALVLCTAMCLVEGGAHADAGSPAERAAEIYKRANVLYDAGKLDAAAKLYREAWAISKSYDIASNLGAVCFDRGEYRDAAELLSYALANFPAGGKAAERQALEKGVKLARARVGVLRITVNVPRAQVRIDGQALGDAPAAPEVFVAVGKHTIEAVADGYVTQSATIDAKAGESYPVNLEMQPVAPHAPTTTPSSSASSIATAAPEPSRAPAIVLGVIGGVGALLGAGAAIGAAIVSSDADALAKRINPTNDRGFCVGAPGGDCSALLDKRRTQGALENTALFSFVGAGLAGAGALIYVLTHKAPEPLKTSVVVVPAVDAAGHPSLLISGAW